MWTTVGHGLAGPKINCNYSKWWFRRLCPKGVRLIFLNYMLWCWYGNVMSLGYCGWSSYRRSLLLLKVLRSWNKFALRLDYSTLKALCFSQCMVHFGRFLKSCVSIITITFYPYWLPHQVSKVKSLWLIE